MPEGKGRRHMAFPLQLLSLLSRNVNGQPLITMPHDRFWDTTMRPLGIFTKTPEAGSRGYLTWERGEDEGRESGL